MTSPVSPYTGAEVWRGRIMLCYPAILLVAFILSAATCSILSSKPKEEEQASTASEGKPSPVVLKNWATRLPLRVHMGKWARGVFQAVSLLVVLTFVVDAVTLVPRILDPAPDSQFGDDEIVYVVGGFFFHFYVLLTLVQWNNTPNMAHCVVWFIAVAQETVILTTSIIHELATSHVVEEPAPSSGGQSNRDRSTGADWEWIQVVPMLLRTIFLANLVALYLIVAAKSYHKQRDSIADENQHDFAGENTPLLGRHETTGYDTDSRPHSPDNHPRSLANDSLNGSSYEQKDDGAAFYRPKKVPHKTWWEYCRGYGIFFQYLWPRDNLRLQLTVLLCVVLVIGMRAVNVLFPMQIGKVISMLTATVQDGQAMQWSPLCILVLYKALQGNAGILGAIRGIIWVPVNQHAFRAIATRSFEHVHSLSLDFHLSKNTGEVCQALNKGDAINTFLEQVTFNVLPMMFDLFIAILFFYWEFGPVYALAVSIMTFYYLHISVQMARTRVDERREMVNLDRAEYAVKTDSITSYETVKYFNAEQREFSRYREAITKFQTAEAKVLYGAQNMNIAQTAVFATGFGAIVTMCAVQVWWGTRTVGQFVSMMTYLNQLQGPLNFFATFYKTIQQSMVAGERLLALLRIKPSVVDRPGAKELTECTGHVRWKDVKFSYDHRRPALRNLNFECKPGTTTAFVGESGGGKSTIFRLMFRYYNCEEGSIEIDGQDVKDLTIDSVRKFIGVVPQDTILFNETLMFNMKFANPDATDEDVYEACRAAAIHDRIMGFPDGYNTNVGERGLRLSGGEKQRIAIARAILKRAKIIMLDEATSALDGETEQRIQSKLINGTLGQDRTLLIIAHRLSTVLHADQIIVLHNGTIAEKGTHESLLALGGRYASMWDRHCRAERAVYVARVATTKANKLLARANISPTDHGHHADESDGYASIESSTILQTGMNSPHCNGHGSSSGSDAGSEAGSDDHDSDGCHSHTHDEPRGLSHNGTARPAMSSYVRAAA